MRANRASRLARPFENFFQSVSQCIDAADLILAGSIDARFTPLLERSAVISAVTSIEVYYRDMLDSIFRICKPSFFIPRLRQLHSDKYDITDLVEIYQHRIHPLELVVSNQSFQSVEAIDRIFSRFVDKGFWSAVLHSQVRLKERPEQIATWKAEDLDELRRLFELRHELVHDPARSSFMSEKVLESLWSATHLVFGSDLILLEVLNEERDPELDSDGGA